MKYLLYFSALILSLQTSAQSPDLLLPEKIDREKVITHQAFTLSYSSAYVMPSWVTYKVTPESGKASEIKGKYTPDPNVTARSASKKDYKDSGYLMAQLVNYTDVANLENADEETYYMTNIVPMKLGFYKHMWLKLEDLVRLWAQDKDGLYIFCGPVTKDAPFATFGKNKVSAPKRFYKVIYDAKNQKAIGFLFKNGVSSGSLKSYSLALAAIEKETGINFLPGLDEQTAQSIKSKVDYDFWQFEVESKKF